MISTRNSKITPARKLSADRTTLPAALITNMTTSSNEQPELSEQPQSCTIEELPPDDTVGPSTSQPEAARAGSIDAADQAAEVNSPEQAEGGSAVSTSDDEQLQQLLADCDRLKQEGNAAYARGDYDEALQLYWQVGCLC
jgi:hypothetical protein